MGTEITNPNKELQTDRYAITFRQLSDGGPGGYESVYLTSEGNPTCNKMYEILSSLEGILLPAANKMLRHRNGETLLHALQNNEQIGIASGFKPSGAYHFGHKLTSSTVAFFQKNGAQVLIPVADIECSMDAKLSHEQYKFWAADNLLDWGANGVNLDAAHTYLQSEEHRVNMFAYFVARSMKFDHATDIYGMEKMIDDFPFLFAGITQVGDILLPQHPDFGNYHSFMVSGQDQDGHMKMTIALTEASLKNNIPLPGVKTTPSGLYIPHIRGISGDKASSSKTAGTLYLGSGPQQEDLDSRIHSTLKKYDAADKEHVERCALDMIRYIDVFNMHSKIDFSDICNQKKYTELIDRMNHSSKDEQKIIQTEIDTYLIGICKEKCQDNIALVRDIIPGALKDHQKKREEILAYAIQKAQKSKDPCLQKHTVPKFWKVPQRAVVNSAKQNPTKWYDIINNAASKLIP